MRYIFTKHAQNYARNPYGLCLWLSMLWIKSQLKFGHPPNTRSQKYAFFQATAKSFMPDIGMEPTETEREIKIDQLMQRMHKANIISAEEINIASPTCENFICTPVAGIYAITANFFGDFIANFIIPRMKFKFHTLAIFINSVHLNHAMAMMIKIKPYYITVSFYDPNSARGDVKTILSLKIAEPPNFEDYNRIYLANVIQGFIDVSGLHSLIRNRSLSDIDFTLTCLNTEPHIRHQLDCNNNIAWLNSSPLYVAAQNGHVEVVRVLLADPRINVNHIGHLIPILSAAIIFGDVQIANMLLDRQDMQITPEDRAWARIANFVHPKISSESRFAFSFNSASDTRV